MRFSQSPIKKEVKTVPKPYPTGFDVIQKGQCGMKAFSPHQCMFCSYGHMLECHYPMTCEEAECEHYLREMEVNRKVY
jgi:hypothetical protein